jgi:hypothetical protein
MTAASPENWRDAWLVWPFSERRSHPDGRSDPNLTPPSNTPLGKPHGVGLSARTPKRLCYLAACRT